MKVTDIVLAFDSDAFINRDVAFALEKSALKLKESGYIVAIETWDAKMAKGIDDALARGLGIVLHAGTQTFKVIKQIVASAIAADPTADEIKLINARKLVLEAPDQLNDNPDIAFQSDVLRALLLLQSQDTGLFSRFRRAVKRMGSITDWNSAREKEASVQQDEIWSATRSSDERTFDDESHRGDNQANGDSTRAFNSDPNCPQAMLPEVLVNCRQPREIIENFWEVIHARNKKTVEVFRRGNYIVQPHFDEHGRGDLVEVSLPKMSGLLIRTADLIKIVNKAEVPSTLPEYIPRDMTTIPDQSLPSLNTITGSPYFNKNGRLIVVPGYHKDDEVFLQYPTGFTPLGNIKPVSADEARAMLDWAMLELLSDFPFSSDMDRMHTLIAFFQPALRKMIFGPTPMLLFNAATPGSGKTLLAQISNVIATGEGIAPRVLSGNEDERKKMFISELMRGHPIILLDNLDDEMGESYGRPHGGKLHSPSLASILTSTTYTDRILGVSKMVEAPNEALWIMTGNNPQLTLELARRCVSIRIEAETEKPWERSDESFRHPDILRWTRDNRKKLLEVILTAIQSWISAGAPQINGKSYGSYEAWSATMRSLLGFLGFDSFLENQGKVEVAVDPLRTVWIQVVEKWYAVFGETPVTTGQILDKVGVALLSPLTGSSLDAISRKISLGKQLSKNNGSIFGGFKIAIAPHSESEANRYVLIPLSAKKGGFGGKRGDDSSGAADVGGGSNWNGNEGEQNE